MKLQVKLLHHNAKKPVYSSAGAIGIDLHACLEDKQVIDFSHGAQVVVPTGIAVEIPDGYYGRIAPRSGLAFRYGFDVLAGVIDPDYRGELKVILDRNSHGPFVAIINGDRVAQLIIEKAVRPQLHIVNTLGDTVRGENGFGSTGM